MQISEVSPLAHASLPSSDTTSAEQASRIPYILHQTWKSKTDLPDRFKYWRDTFLEHNPDVDYRFYDDDDNRELLRGTFPQLLPLYDAFPREIFRVDFIRAIYMYRFGGYYADLDFQCLAKLPDLAIADVVLGKMGTDDNMLHCIPNAFMASVPGEGFWLRYLAQMETAWEKNKHVETIWERPEYITGPVVLRTVALRYQNAKPRLSELTRSYAQERLGLEAATIPFGDLAVCPSHILYPINWKDRIHRAFLKEVHALGLLYSTEQALGLFPTSKAVTYWSHSWNDAVEPT